MTVDSPLPPRLSPARPQARPRPSAAAAGAEAAASLDGSDQPAPIPSLIGDGPGQYLLGCENRQSFDQMKAAFDGELRPADPIERMWVDEVVDLEWDIHRLRTTRRLVVENALTDSLASRVFQINSMVAYQPPDGESPVETPRLGEIRYYARACIRGDPEAHEYIRAGLGILRLEDEYQNAYQMTSDALARLESSIHAASRLRDSIIARLYVRRQLIVGRRTITGQAHAVVDANQS